jgi:hypothetical protein
MMLSIEGKTMMTNSTHRRAIRCAFLLTGLSVGMASMVGCQSSINGQTLPSPYYLQDDVQYFPSGPEFKLPREAAALRAAQAEEKRNRR